MRANRASGGKRGAEKALALMAPSSARRPRLRSRATAPVEGASERLELGTDARKSSEWWETRGRKSACPDGAELGTAPPSSEPCDGAGRGRIGEARARYRCAQIERVVGNEGQKKRLP